MIFIDTLRKERKRGDNRKRKRKAVVPTLRKRPVTSRHREREEEGGGRRSGSTGAQRWRLPRENPFSNRFPSPLLRTMQAGSAPARQPPQEPARQALRLWSGGEHRASGELEAPTGAAKSLSY
ncbi:hypothetical protein E2C01_009921 [Portunus trituberculatus]|uniref:Uncharacterized protein n=1 Tax=Portunus trituberculatus TaxID=210409 RepID=A0A5B7D7B7_PORTR|nr:hypothetical protein [Portunus trituberculatus]